MVMMYLGIVGKRFKDAGLRDIFIQSQVLAEGSVTRLWLERCKTVLCEAAN